VVRPRLVPLPLYRVSCRIAWRAARHGNLVISKTGGSGWIKFRRRTGRALRDRRRLPAARSRTPNGEAARLSLLSLRESSEPKDPPNRGIRQASITRCGFAARGRGEAEPGSAEFPWRGCVSGIPRGGPRLPAGWFTSAETSGRKSAGRLAAAKLSFVSPIDYMNYRCARATPSYVAAILSRLLTSGKN